MTVLAVLAKLVQQIVTTWPGEKADISAYKGLFAFSLPADLNVYLAGQHQLDILQRTAAIMPLTVHKPFSLELQRTYAVRPESLSTRRALVHVKLQTLTMVAKVCLSRTHSHNEMRFPRLSWSSHSIWRQNQRAMTT